MNTIIVAGNLTRTAELRAMPDGTPVLVFGIADNVAKNKPPIFWNCSMFGNRAEAVAPLLQKGKPVTVSGVISEREWIDKDGQPRRSMDVRVNDLALQGGASQADEGDGFRQAPAQRQAPAAPARQAPAARRALPQARSNDFNDFDSDAPF